MPRPDPLLAGLSRNEQTVEKGVLTLRRAWHELKIFNVSDVTFVRLELVERLTESFSTA